MISPESRQWPSNAPASAELSAEEATRLRERARFVTASFVARLPNETNTLTTGATMLLSPSLTNELRFNHSYTTGESSSRLDDFGGARPLTPEEFFPTTVDDANAFGGYTLSGGINSAWYLGTSPSAASSISGRASNSKCEAKCSTP